MKTANYLNKRFFYFWMVLLFTGCKKLVDIQAPATSISQANIYSSDATAISVLTGIYTEMSIIGSPFNGLNGISLEVGLSADDWTLYSGATSSNFEYAAYFQNQLSATIGTGSDFWAPLYSEIYSCNAAIEGISQSTSITPPVRKQLLSEARFLRAFNYFYLVNLFGDVPLALTTDYKLNALLSRTPKTQVYQQIITDLKFAEDSLSTDYLDGSLQPYSGAAEKVRPTKWAAAAMLARVYLYTQSWDSAEAQSTMIINNSSLFSLDSLNGVFLKNSNEAIWQLQPIDAGYNTGDAQAFIIPSTGFSGGTWPVYLSNSLLNSFDSLDNRKNDWISSYSDNTGTYFYAYKYKDVNYGDPVTEYLMVLRLAEQFLIRAEARAQQNTNLMGAENDLNAIRTRAGLSITSASSQSDLLAAIQHERRLELFSEWGHRWLDLKRTGSVDSVMTIATPIKSGGSPWQTYQQLYPLPFVSDIQTDPNLVQNQGY